MVCNVLLLVLQIVQHPECLQGTLSIGDSDKNELPSPVIMEFIPQNVSELLGTLTLVVSSPDDITQRETQGAEERHTPIIICSILSDVWQLVETQRSSSCRRQLPLVTIAELRCGISP